MELATRSSAKLHQSDSGGHPLLLNLPRLGHQRSLQDLIEADLNFQADESLDTMGSRIQRNENLDLNGATIKAPATEVWDERRGCSASSESGSQDHKTTDIHMGTKPSHKSHWMGVFKRNRANSEHPKTVFSHKRRQVLREIILIHFLPVTINSTLLGLYVWRVSWAPPWPTTNVLNALQFAAKVHETLMIASLVSVLLHHIRYRLLCPGRRGLPLGLTTSPFRLLDITYLWSREFLAATRDLHKFCITETITIVVHVFLFVLAAVLGPASASIMMPRLGEWDLAKNIINAPFYSIHDQNIVYQAYMGAELSQVFPSSITASSIPEACDHGNLSLPQTNTCPRLGFTDILQGIRLPENSHDASSLPSSQESSSWADYNITVQPHNHILPTRVITVETFSPESSPHGLVNYSQAVVDVTTSTDTVLFLTQNLIYHYLRCWLRTMSHAGSAYIGSFYSEGEWPAHFTLYAGEVSTLWKQPYVSSFCSEPGVGDTAFDSLTFNFAQQDGTQPYRVNLDAKLLSTVLGDRGMGFIDSSNLNITPSYKTSAAVAFTSQSYTTLCLVKAYWIDSTLSGPLGGLTWGWQAEERGHETCGGCQKFRAENDWFDTANTTEIIHLGLDWLQVLDHGTGGGSTGQFSFFDKVRRVCLGSSVLSEDIPEPTGGYPNLDCFAAGLGAGIAEGLSKVPYNVDIHALGTIEDLPYNTITLSPWTSSTSFFTKLYDFSGNWTNSTLTPAQIKANSTRFDFTLTQKVYGYSFGSVTITLAFVVLSLYVATVFVHTLILIFGTSWSSRAWKSLGEFYVLALQSPTPTSVLDNTGGGVKLTKTWQARASVQELQCGRRVGMVVEDSSPLNAGEGLMPKVRPDWKYS